MRSLRVACLVALLVAACASAQFSRGSPSATSSPSPAPPGGATSSPYATSSPNSARSAGAARSPSPSPAAATYPLAPPHAVQAWLTDRASISLRPLTAAELASVRISAAEAERTVFHVPGPGYGFGNDHFTWTKIGCVFLGWFTAEPEPSVGYVPPTYPAYLVQVLAPPVPAYPGENIGMGVVDARTGERGAFYGSGSDTILGTTCGVTP